MSDVTAAWSDLQSKLREQRVLGGVRAAIAWDQQTMMPPAGAGLRGEQSALLMRLSHERHVDPAIGEALAALEAGDLDEVQRATVRNVRRSYERETKVSATLVERIGLAQAKGFDAWHKAKEADDFAAYAPVLEELLELAAERAQTVAPDQHPYQTMLDEYDPGVKLAALKGTFGRLQAGLTELIDASRDVADPPPVDEVFSTSGQLELHKVVAAQLGYDFQRGRLDQSAHPFTISLGSPDDVRITTAISEDALLSGLGGTIHEAGHGLYEQGLPKEWIDTGVASAASLGLHESQSRFWENFIGRSEPFFGWFEGQLRDQFPKSRTTAAQMYRAANRIQPSLVRVYADEVTYNLHIIIRFELELALFEGRLKVRDLPEAWNSLYEKYLGIRPGTDREGVLQDVHWSGMAFGYFQSYTLGNLYAAAFGATIQEELPNLWNQVGEGDFSAVLEWLRTRIHSKGHLVDAPELVRGVVGERDYVEDLLGYLWGRHGALYGLSRSK